MRENIVKFTCDVQGCDGNATFHEHECADEDFLPPDWEQYSFDGPSPGTTTIRHHCPKHKGAI